MKRETTPTGRLASRSINGCPALVCWLAAGILGFPLMARGATLIVDHTAPGAYRSLRAAYAAANNGDTIRVQADLFLESPGQFLPAKQVTIQATGYKATVSVNAPPINDSPGSPIALSGNAVVALGNNYTATIQSGEPAAITNLSTKTVWWTWTAPTPSSCGVQFSTFGSDFPTVIAVFDSSMTLRGSNENTVVITPGAGQTYFVAVGGQGAAYGKIQLNIESIGDATNNAFANRITVPANHKAAATYCNASATKEAGEPNHAGNPGGHSVWWEWTPSYSSLATVSVQAASYDTLVGIYTGSSVNSLTPVASNDDGAANDTKSLVSIQAIAGTKYQIALDGKNGSSGTAKLKFLQYPPLAITALTNLDFPAQSDPIPVHGNAMVANFGTAASGPLRLRLVAEPHNNLSNAQSLAVFPLSPITPGPNQNTMVSFSGLLPPPGDWDYFVVLEEAFSGVWLIQDAEEFQVPWHRTDRGTAGPVLLQASNPGGQWTPVSLTNIAINVTNPVLEGQSYPVSGTARFSSGYTQSFSNTTWNVSLFTITTNGILQLGAVNQDTGLTITSPYNFNGTPGSASRQITVKNLPAPVNTNFVIQPGPVVHFTIRGVPNRRHVVQTSTNLVIWSNGATQSCDANGVLEFYDSGAGAEARRFYRVMELP